MNNLPLRTVQMTNRDWQFTLAMFDDDKAAELLGCDVDYVREKREKLKDE